MTRQRWGVVLAELLLAPVLGVIGFGFAFVGYGLSPDGDDALGAQDVVVLILYLVVLVTVLVLPAGAVLSWIAARSSRPVLARRAAAIPLAMAAVSAVILVGLLVAASAFGQSAGP